MRAWDQVRALPADYATSGNLVGVAPPFGLDGKGGAALTRIVPL